MKKSDDLIEMRADDERPVIAQCLEYPVGAFGGVEVLVRALLRELQGKFRTILVSDDSVSTLSASGVNSLIELHIPWNPASFSAGRAQGLARQLRSHRTQLAHFHAGNYAWGNRVPGRSPLVHVRRAGIPIVSTNHGAFSLLDGYCGSHRPLWQKIALLPVPWLGKVQSVLCTETEIAVSKNDESNLRCWYWPARQKFRQIYHSNLDVGEPVASPGDRENTILCVGTIGERKGQIYLVKAFAQIAQRVPDWKLVIAGRNGHPEMMSQIVQMQKQPELAGRIVLIDTLSDDQIAETMRKSSIFAMPSLLEGLGLSLQEALFRGCACIASRVGGIPELVRDGDTGILVTPGSIAELAEGLSRLINDSSLRQRLSERGRDFVLSKGMTSKQMALEYNQLYRKVLEQQRR